MSRSTVRNLLAAFVAVGTFPSLGAEGLAIRAPYLELRGGAAVLSTTMKNRDSHVLMPVPTFDLITGWEAGWLETRVRINVTLADTNTAYIRNGIVTNSPYYPRAQLLARNYFLSVRESVPIRPFHGPFSLLPSLELKMAHYNDLSAASEFTNRTTDWLFSFLNAGLELRFDTSRLGVYASYHYPLFGVLTDAWLREERQEDEFEVSGRLKWRNGWLSVGYNGFTLRYVQDTRNGAGVLYDRKTHAAVFASLGWRF